MMPAAHSTRAGKEVKYLITDMLKYVLLWFVLFAVAFTNGALRELTYGKRMSEHRRHVTGTVTGVILIGITIYLIDTVWPFHGRSQALYVGLIWALMTVISESAMLLIFMKKDFKTLIGTYDVTKGQLWPFVLLFLIIFPPLIAGSGG